MDQETNVARRVLVGAILGGLTLRLIAVIWGDLDPGGDGLQRLWIAVEWAAHPQWQGLSGVWPPLHHYLLGALIWIWKEPVWLARGLNLLMGIGSLFVLRAAVRPGYGELTAAVAMLFLAFNWTHIWLTSSYWVEIPYLLLVFGALYFAEQARAEGRARHAWSTGLCLALAVLLRHEGVLLIALFAGWFGWHVRPRRQGLQMMILPVIACLWQWVEPWWMGGSYFDFVETYRSLKSSENRVHGFSLIDRLGQIFLMPAVVPSLLVVIPGFLGLWAGRKRWRDDLFGWLFATHLLFTLWMALQSGWRPQLRYVLLYFVFLFPAAASTWVRWAQRGKKPIVLFCLLILMVGIQASGWYVGRNERRAWGWLPLRIRTEAQISLDDWVRERRDRLVNWPGAAPLQITHLVTGALDQPWRLPHSLLLHGVYLPAAQMREYNLAYQPQIFAGPLPDDLIKADLVVLDTRMEGASSLITEMTGQGKDTKIEKIHPHVTILLLSPLAQQLLR
ncbi:MAG: ArnT family glycosyltransferase [Blastocatellia bacterium]|jgi:hypothetical protein